MATANKNYKPMSQEMHYIMDHAHALVDATTGELDDRIKSARTALNQFSIMFEDRLPEF